jgi:hypothetical protein
MAIYDPVEIVGKTTVKRDRRSMLLRESKRLRERSERMVCGETQHHGGESGSVDDNLGAGTDSGKQGGKITGCLVFRNVDGRHTHDDTSRLRLQRLRSRLPG